MITFRQIRRQELFAFFVSMYRVAVFVHLKNIENLLFLACPFFGKTFFLEIRNPDFGTWFGPFLQFLSKIGYFMSLFRQNLFSENKKPLFWDMIRPILHPSEAIPRKWQKWFSENKKPRFWDMPSVPTPSEAIPRKWQRLFSENKNPRFWDCPKW